MGQDSANIQEFDNEGEQDRQGEEGRQHYGGIKRITSEDVADSKE